MADTQSSAFSDLQYDFCYPPGVERHWWMRARAAIVDALVRDGGGGGPVLEIGCGNGATLSLLRAHGLDCRGVELADVSVRDDVKTFITANCDAAQLPDDVRHRMETILLLDVVEHIEQPDAFLRRIAASFNAARRMVITVPARKEVWSNYDEFYGHYRRYDLAGLRALGEAQGWRLRRAGYAFRITYPPARVLAALKLPRSVKVEVPNGAAALVHRALAALTVWEWHLLPAALPGTSVIASFDL